MTVSFYLKYRPQKFLDLDSSEAREELLKIFKSEKIPHALLFSGPRGIGKTSAARIVAKAVNCEKVQSTEYKEHREFEPCNQCDSCISITNGTNVDILEIDAASNRGIDDIKELREKIKLSPASAKYKVYIIDEAHMLTPEAFNALLKTLEEPPKHAIFILCTTDPEKLPKTIISRCQRINFKKASNKEIV
ncbi:DNA polymerase III, subunit gamma and tau, partial [Candidatus Shapirobacteria bacterium CG03_land_8_20_14_0_80_39_12]